MNKQRVSCSAIISQAKRPFVLYHQQLGCFRSDWHRHSWGQLVYAEKGCIHLHSEGKKILLPGWYGAWIPADTHHEIWSDSTQLHMRSICFPVEASNTALSGRIAVFPVSALLREMIRYTEKWSASEGDDTQITTFLQAIQDLLPSEMDKAIPTCLPSTTHEKLAPVVAYIQQHLSRQVSLQSLASQYGLSVRTLTRLFTQQLGTSFSSYCKIARVMKALELIETGRQNVSELAFDVGYESVSTFSNNFLEICGHRPYHFIHKERR